MLDFSNSNSDLKFKFQINPSLYPQGKCVKNLASYFQRCTEYVDVAGSLKFSSLPMWIVQKLQIHPEPQRPRCKNYELDFTKPKVTK